MKIRRSFVASLAVAALVGSLFSVVAQTAAPTPASAASASDFNPGFLISDEKFYDGTTMGAAQIQTFLNEQLSRCTIGDPGRLPGSPWNGTFIASACLKDYKMATASRPADARCAAYAGSPSESAAQIIAKVGVACGISPQALLVLLEKEQSLVTDSWPTVRQIDRAMGYACPDSGPGGSANCDPSQYGFVHQVYKAAWQFKVYKDSPNSFNHIAGRYNNVRYHPNVSCGASQVFIQNNATAGLYNYTPYQPNASALANLYGTGDGCASYGNRNFWRIFSDWFGSPTGSSDLVRTVNNSTVYVTSGSIKYPIASSNVLAALAPLGKVDYVTDAYLAKFTTAHVATQVVRGPDGSIYYIGSGIKLPFTNCALVGHYGGSCNTTGFVQLDANQVARFHTGPALSQLMGTVEGSRYFMENGFKREILDVESQTQAGIGGAMNVLTESTLADRPFGVPVVRGSAVVTHLGTSQVSLLDASQVRWNVGSAEATSWGLASRSAGRLRQASIDKLVSAPAAFNGFISNPSGSIFGLSSATSRFSWAPPSGVTLTTTPLSDAFVNLYTQGASIGVGSFVKTPNSGTIYLITDPLIRPIGSWETLVSMSELGNPQYSIVPEMLIGSLPSGPIALQAATLVRSEADATVYIVNGISNKIPISSFDPATEAGLTQFSFTLQDRITAYPTSEKVMEYGLRCDTTNYISAGGAIHALTPELSAQYPFPYIELDQYVCRLLKVGKPATQFIRTPDGNIFQMIAGVKRPVESMARYAELDTTGAGYLNVTPRFAQMISTGPAA